ncbi:LamB/YcsF family protein [Photobacterium malacitanum]|uniref:LamB/YcsF family protein n=1 Tax=Photobacterium malacitanum TaxID=2204294 RepID=A0A1Y6MKY8_9GAMM|nr:5-oxoprolinase subunit PxpA [Photobacterium malacitanum]SMY35871.1 LamB/YcsF family protein [Photobacterium malacitanum]
MKLNCDMGESFGVWKKGNDSDVMASISMANIACGFHAADPDTMAETIRLANQHGVMLGAHPSYDDKLGFGRRHIAHSLPAIAHLMSYQIGALESLCQLQNSTLHYVKPHGALYHDMMMDEQIFTVIIKTLNKLNHCRQQPLALMVLSRKDNQYYKTIAHDNNVSLIFEAFADRTYLASGMLMPREQPNAILSSPAAIQQQMQQLLQGKVQTLTGDWLLLEVDSICVHGDNPTAVQSVKTLAELIIAANPCGDDGG